MVLKAFGEMENASVMFAQLHSVTPSAAALLMATWIARGASFTKTCNMDIWICTNMY